MERGKEKSLYEGLELNTIEVFSWGRSLEKQSWGGLVGSRMYVTATLKHILLGEKLGRYN